MNKLQYDKTQHLYLFNEIKQVLLPFIGETQSEQPSKQGEISFYCPFCKHKNPNFSVNIITTMWKCWVCGTSGYNIYTLAKKINIKITVDVNKYVDLIKQRFKIDFRIDFKPSIINKPIKLPFDYNKDIKKDSRAIEFLYKRNITDDIIYEYDIGFSKYYSRIVFPSYDINNNLNYYVNRDYTELSPIKYMNPPCSKNIVFYENKINWKLPIVICEGVFDALTVRYNAIPLLGSFINESIIKNIIMNDCTVYIMLDGDAKEKTITIYSKLINYGVSNVYVIGIDNIKDDCNSLGFEKTWNLIQTNAKSFTEQELFMNSIIKKLS